MKRVVALLEQHRVPRYSSKAVLPARVDRCKRLEAGHRQGDFSAQLSLLDRGATVTGMPTCQRCAAPVVPGLAAACEPGGHMMQERSWLDQHTIRMLPMPAKPHCNKHQQCKDDQMLAQEPLATYTDICAKRVPQPGSRVIQAGAEAAPRCVHPSIAHRLQHAVQIGPAGNLHTSRFVDFGSRFTPPEGARGPRVGLVGEALLSQGHLALQGGQLAGLAVDGCCQGGALGHIGVAGLVAHQAAQFALGRPQLCYRLLQSALLLLQAPSLGSLHPAARMLGNQVGQLCWVLLPRLDGLLGLDLIYNPLQGCLHERLLLIAPSAAYQPDRCASLFERHLQMADTQKVGVLVIGAGPTGLGAATRLNQHGLKDWLLIDQASPLRTGCHRLLYSVEQQRKCCAILAL
eukprot:jgi/Astpho2/9369/Aster-01639